MKKILFTTIQCVFFSVCAIAQQVTYSNWAIGNGGGLKFENGNVTQFQSQMACQDMGSTISDGVGNLLFYCNGTTVYNKNHNIMVNGSGLLGDITGGHAALILNQPESDFYFIFTIDKYADSDGLRYHVVDMSANGGLGEVISKNDILLNPASEKIAAVWNAPQRCYKIITHKFGNNEFHVFELNGNGLNTTPVISAVGTVHQAGYYGQAHDALGQMSISPNGNKVALALCFSGRFELYDFNKNTGVLSNPVLFGHYSFAWGIDFSPNSQLVYFTQWTQHKVYQADISSNDSTTINSSILELGSITGAGQYSVGYVSRTPDNRIFIAKYGYNSLATITNPDVLGAGCNFDEAGLVLQYGSSTAGLSDSPVFPANVNSIKESKKDVLTIYPNPNSGSFNIVKSQVIVNGVLNIYNLNSELVNSIKLNDNKLSETIDLNVNSGVYFVKINSKEGEVFVDRIVITK